MAAVTPVMTPSLGGFLTPMMPGQVMATASGIVTVSPLYIPFKSSELVNKMSGGGLSIDYRFFLL